MSSWSMHPNAAHIDGVLGSLPHHATLWDKAWQRYGGTIQTTRTGVFDTLGERGLSGTYVTLSGAIYTAVVNRANEGPHHTRARHSARASVQALLAWDEASALLDAPLEHVLTLAKLGNPQAILMLPACFVSKELR
jgi:hypothetical protein